MKCPNDSTEMCQVKIEGHYGQPILLEQCKECGGIWFDEMELFSARHGEAFSLFLRYFVPDMLPDNCCV